MRPEQLRKPFVGRQEDLWATLGLRPRHLLVPERCCVSESLVGGARHPPPHPFRLQCAALLLRQPSHRLACPATVQPAAGQSNFTPLGLSSGSQQASIGPRAVQARQPAVDSNHPLHCLVWAAGRCYPALHALTWICQGFLWNPQLQPKPWSCALSQQ